MSSSPSKASADANGAVLSIEEELKKEMKKKFLFNVPYIFSKVEQKKHYNAIVKTLTRSLEIQIN